MARILIAGWPRVGKTTLAAKLTTSVGGAVRHTDDVVHLGWSPASLEVSTWLEDDGPFIVEGVAVPRAIRKYFDRNGGAPADTVYWSATPREELTSRQASMGKGCDSVWNEIHDELVRRGVRVTLF